ncbi:DUF885 domain-containing protein [Larkinella terrae]|uniref:DUF885 family protein n=1 Tax=Larkinella terrae TaxID=2025311 RepID=A0A7K0EEL8_9BACT|nr:DUF885 domain-containing protein [Larkinella terrae]MRS60273.1 DUF885 family protein [Larkinella terrae]
MTTPKRTWKFWLFRSFLLILLIGCGWLVNLIWFRPFSIRHFYDRMFIAGMLRSPEIITFLGLPVLYDWTKEEWDDASDAGQWRNFEKLKADYQTLQRYDFENQSTENKLNTKILGWYLKNEVDREPFFYHNYPLNQLDGIQGKVPQLLIDKHQLRTKSDIEAYITRLRNIPVKFDQVLEGLYIRERKGIIPPKFVIGKVLTEMKSFIAKGVEANSLYTNFARKTASINDLAADEKTAYTKQVAEAIRTAVFGAYRKMIAYEEGLFRKATPDAGVWKLPDGDAYYRYQLRFHTTTDLSPEQVHQLGLQEVSRIQKEMRAILRSEGYTNTTQTLGVVIHALSQEPRFLFPETPAGKALILAEYERILKVADQEVGVAFDRRPKVGLTVEPTPAFKEAGDAIGRYQMPSLDGSKGGVFVANLRHSSEHPKFAMKTLAYHEGIPGHHFQVGIQMELKGLPIFRTVIPFTAYDEGWALYTEQLAYELGFYRNDSFGNLGRLQAELFRATRLVVDTGLHHKRWTREAAIAYMIANTGLTESQVTTEVERYAAFPGQACAYKIGMLKILELREKARQALGEKFDLKDFHRVVLANGAMPLPVLEETVNTWIEQVKP